MKRFINTFKLSARKLCILALLTAITALLAMFATIRVGNIVKIPLKFISVFVTGVFFGPFWAGISAAFGDILNALLMPVGNFLPQITAIEFVSGFVFGAFMFNTHENNNGYFLKAILCVIFQALIDLFLTSAALVQVGIFPSFTVAFNLRVIATLIKTILWAIVLFSAKGYLLLFSKYMGEKHE